MQPAHNSVDRRQSRGIAEGAARHGDDVAWIAKRDDELRTVATEGVEGVRGRVGGGSEQLVAEGRIPKSAGVPSVNTGRGASYRC